MNDRELLELAAKAAGMAPIYDANDCFVCWVGECDTGHWWDPLKDDGDALRLALALRLDVEFDGPRGVRVKYDGPEGVPCMVDEYLSSKDAASDLRRAIVLAAAEIGRVE